MLRRHSPGGRRGGGGGAGRGGRGSPKRGGAVAASAAGLWAPRVIKIANARFDQRVNMSIPGKAVRGLREFDTTETFDGVEVPVIESHGIKSYPRSYVEFSGSTATAEELGDAVSRKKVYVGAASKGDKGKESFIDCVRMMNEDVAWTGTEFEIPINRMKKGTDEIKLKCTPEQWKRFESAPGCKLDRVYNDFITCKKAENPADLFKGHTGLRLGICKRCVARGRHYAGVCTVQFRRVKLEDDQFQFVGKFRSWIMHNVNCNEAQLPEDRFHRLREDGLPCGPNWVVMKYPRKEIYGNNLDALVERFREWDPSLPLPRAKPWSIERRCATMLHSQVGMFGTRACTRRSRQKKMDCGTWCS